MLSQLSFLVLFLQAPQSKKPLIAFDAISVPISADFRPAPKFGL
jgi:hypothetical protein